MEHIVNSSQAAAWNGYEGRHWARHQDRWDAVNEGFDAPLMAAAAIGTGHRVLDIGCGAGRTTRLAARAAGAGGGALGLDLSGPMLERARTRAAQEGVGGAEFVQGDAQVHPLPAGAFDRAVSRYGVMFFADPVAAFTNIGRALRPGGRLAFVAAADADRNEWLTAVLSALRPVLPAGGLGSPGASGMFSLDDPVRTADILSAAGFEDVRAVRVEAAGDWGRDADDAASFLLGSGPAHHLLAAAAPEVREEARRTLVGQLRPYERDGAVRLRSSAWLVTAERPRRH